MDQMTTPEAQFYVANMILTNWKLSIDKEIGNFLSALTGNPSNEIKIENVQGEYKSESISEKLQRLKEGKKEEHISYEVGDFPEMSGIPIKIFKIKRIGQKTSFYVSNFEIKLYIIQDILMNAIDKDGNLVFGDMVIDESVKPSKESTYIYASTGRELDDTIDQPDNLLKCSVTVKQVKKASSPVKTILTKIGETLDENSYFTQFRIIFAETNEEEKKFRERIKKLLYYYHEHENEIEEEYSEEIGNVVTHRRKVRSRSVPKKETKSRKKFGIRASQIDPELYGGASRKCQGQRVQPNVLCKVDKPFVFDVPRDEDESFRKIRRTEDIPRSEGQMIHPFPPHERGDGSFVQYVLECKEENKEEEKGFIGNLPSLCYLPYLLFLLRCF